MAKLTWGHRWTIALMLAIAGAVYLWSALSTEIGGIVRDNDDWPLILAWASAAAFAGAGIAGVIVASGFGRSGAAGWLVAAVSGAVATLLGGAFGGTFILPVYGTITGPFVVVGYARANPWLFVVWAVLMAAVHLAAARLRNGRPADAVPS